MSEKPPAQRAVEALKATARDIGAPEAAQGAGLADAAAAHQYLQETSTAMTELTIDARDTTNERIWFLIDVSGDAELGEFADDFETVSESPRDSDHTRLAGRVSQGRDSFRVAGDAEITYAAFDGATGGLVVRWGGATFAPEDLPGFDPPPEEPAPEPPQDPTPGQGNPIEGNTYSPSQTRYNVQERPLFSDSDARIVVDKRGGDDGSAGGEGAPVRTIGEAFRRIPLFNLHQVEIVLEDQRHDADDNLFTPPTMANYLRTAGRITMRSRSRDPTECSVELPGGTFFSTGVQGASPLCALNAEGVTFDCAVQNYGTLYAENCHFNGDADIWLKKAVGGYNSWQRFKQCEFGGDADYAIGLKHGLYADFFECDIETGEAVVALQAGAGSVMDWSGNAVECASGWGDERVEEFVTHIY